MKTYTHEYSTKELLNDFIKSNYIHNCAGDCDILVQVFTSVNNEKFITYLRDEILSFLPTAKILGTTTSGEISPSGSLEGSTVISISTFDDTKIETHLVNSTGSSFDSGKNLINFFEVTDELKLLITFTDGLYTNGEEYLNGISSVNKDIVIAGGMAGDNSKFEVTYVFTDKLITNKGAVAAAFYNKNLNIYTDYSFNWETVGRVHTVTRSEKNRVYEIDDMTTVDFYKYYLGDDIAKYLPAIGIEFPLVIKKDGITVARAVLAKHDDGSLSFAGNIPEGSKLQFGHGDVQLIIKKGLDNIKGVIQTPIESIFIYSCMARKALLHKEIDFEILPLQRLAPVSGFFTYGEFYYNCLDNKCSSKLLNQTMTILAISEKNMKVEKVTPNIFIENLHEIDDIKLHRTQALSTLIKRTTKELEDLNANLNQKVKEQVELNAKKDSMLSVLHTQAQLGGLLEMILHQWRQPISAITSALSSLELYKEMGMLTDDLLHKSLDDISTYTNHINATVEDFRDLFRTSSKNKDIKVSELIEKSLVIINSIISKHNIKIETTIKDEFVLHIPVGLIMQVILNIVKNAIDIFKIKNIENPIIEVCSFEDDKSYNITITDNGGGIPEDILPYIFDKNFTTKEDSDGTGIGLDMSRTIIESKVNGSLKATNIDGNKARFIISIPK